MVPGEGIGGVCVGVGGGLRGLWVRGTPDYNRSSILSLPLHMFVVTVLTTLPSLCLAMPGAGLLAMFSVLCAWFLVVVVVFARDEF